MEDDAAQVERRLAGCAEGIESGSRKERGHGHCSAEDAERECDILNSWAKPHPSIPGDFLAHPGENPRLTPRGSSRMGLLDPPRLHCKVGGRGQESQTGTNTGRKRRVGRILGLCLSTPALVMRTITNLPAQQEPARTPPASAQRYTSAQTT
ncbi:hypothetical protein BDV93DRAFT_259904 [Ceratobasidium sp. AG-I]|nr:hypothetical protein BDV93DRAFT_259904 [Ceratobasidium sp. AG-I]